MNIFKVIRFLMHLVFICNHATATTESGEKHYNSTTNVISKSSSPSSKGSIDACSSVHCPQLNMEQTKYGIFTFPRTRATATGETIHRPCPLLTQKSGAQQIFGNVVEVQSGATKTCHLRINDSGCFAEWGETEFANCRSQRTFNLANQIQNVINEPVITANTMRQIIPLLYPLVGDAVNDYETAKVLMECVSKCLQTSEVFGNDNDPIARGFRRQLFEIVDLYTKHVEISPGEKVYLAANHIEVESVYFPSTLPEHIYSYDFDNVSIPRESILQASESRLLIQAYDNELFYLWGNERSWMDLNDSLIIDDEFPEQDFAGKWRVLEIQFDGVKMQNMSQPISYKLQVKLTSNYTWKCAFWDVEEGKWSSEGMTTTIVQEENAVKCESSHLTAFSALIEPIPHDGRHNGLSGLFIIPPIHLHILSVLSSVGSALSIAGLAMTSLTYALFRCLRKERSNKILLNLSTSLLLLHIMSVSSEVDMWGGHCTVPAILLHYLLLTSLGWMLVEGVHMYQLLISVFVKPETRFLLKRSLCAWGIPLVLVGISLAVDKDVYDAGRDDWCIMAGHLNLPLYYATYFAPVVICLAINTFVFVRIIRVLYLQSSRTKQQQMMTSSSFSTKMSKNLHATTKTATGANDWKSVRSSSSSSSHMLSPVQIKGALTVLFLLGIGWTFGLLAVGPFQIVFRYFFCICNAGQGVFIFLFRVVLHPQACRTWRKAVLGLSAESDIFSSSSSSAAGNKKGRNHKHHHHMSRPSFSVSPTFVSTSNSSAENTLNKNDTLTAKLASTLLNLIQSNKNAVNGCVNNAEVVTTTNNTVKVKPDIKEEEVDKNLHTID